MNLATYVEQLPRGGKKLLAIQLGITASYLSRLISGDRSITAERAIQIEDASNGAVSRVELRPDIRWEKPRHSKKPRLQCASTMNQKIRSPKRIGQVDGSAVQASSTGGAQ